MTRAMATEATGSLRQGLADALRGQCMGEVLAPGDEGYEKARAVWNAMIDRRPLVIVRCIDDADVLACVRLARQFKLPVSIRGGGHNVAGHAVGEGAIMIDLSMMRGVVVSPCQKRAIVEGGATWADVDGATQAHGLATPGGLISETGVAGLTLSGGIGWLRSRDGLSIDNLISADVVTAAGKLFKASETENADLFWALRGGGGNFGVVVRFDFALHAIGPTVMFAAPIYPLSAGAAPIRFWRDFLNDKSDRVSSLVEFSTVPSTPDYPEEFWGQRCYTIAAVYAGDAKEGESLLAPLRGLGPVVADFSNQMAYCDVQKLFDTLLPSGLYRCYWKSHLITDLSDELIDEAIANAAASPSGRSISSLWNFGGRTAEIEADATAFGDRSFRWMYSLDSVWEQPSEDAAIINWTREAWQRARRFSHEGRLYLNFAGQDADSAALTRDAFGTAYAKLAAIKSTYDPDNMFRFNQNIEPG
jgi:FAD/FMN-containing dehydrogenase